MLQKWHEKRREYCTLAFNMIITPDVIVIFVVVNRIIKPPECPSFTFYLSNKGGYVPRPLEPAACFGTVVRRNSDRFFKKFISNKFLTQYSVAVYEPPVIEQEISS